MYSPEKKSLTEGMISCVCFDEEKNAADFAEKAAEALSERLGGDITFTVMNRVKTNDLHLTGIVTKDLDASPVIYVDEYEKMVLSGQMSFSECMDEIEETFRKFAVEYPDAAFLDKGPEGLLERLVFRVLSESRNEDLLKERISRELAPGIYAIFDIRVSEDGVIPVSEDTLGLLETDEEEMVKRAFENAVNQYPATICHLKSTLMHEKPKLILDTDKLDFSERPAVFVVTNAEGFMGASALFYEGVQEKIEELLGGDYYAVPSSVHELLVIPEKDAPNISEIREMLIEANGMIAKEDVLSDVPYVYRAGKGLMPVRIPSCFN